MKLTTEEIKMAKGKRGKAKQMAMSILIELAEAYDVEQMIPISAAHIDVSCYGRVLGDVALEFAEKFAYAGGKVSVPTTLNPGGRDIRRWKEFRIPVSFAEKCQRMEDAYLRMGTIPTWTCTPYFYGPTLHFGQQIAWGESNAIVFANSVIGARTARYGDFLDVCAAITGRALQFGLHLSEHRKGSLLIEIRNIRPYSFDNDLIYGLLGYVVGSLSGNGVPVLNGIPADVGCDQLKAFGAGVASSGGVGLFHIIGVTPEAPTLESVFEGRQPSQRIIIKEEELFEAQKLSTAKEGKVDLVLIGCPHASFSEIEKLTQLLNRKKICKSVEFWIQTNRGIYSWIKEMGILQKLKTTGIEVITDTCIFAWPLENWNFNLVVTNSAKFANYAPGELNLNVIITDLSGCIEAGITGEIKKRNTK